VVQERLKLAVFIDFDNIQIGVKDTLKKEFDVSVVLEALKERGEVVSKMAYGDWPRAGEQSRQMTQHAVQMVQRNVTPRGDKNGADINLALDALEMAFTRHHINAFVIVGGDSDFIALVEKLKQYDKRVYVVGGRAFTSNILQANCHEFIAYENLLKSATAGDGSKSGRSSRGRGRPTSDSRPLSAAMPNLRRALKILAEREVAPQVGLLKSTLLQLDPTFSERDYGAGSFLEFMEKMHRAGLVHLRRTDRGHLVEPVSTGEEDESPSASVFEPDGASESADQPPPTEAALPSAPELTDSPEVMGYLMQAVNAAAEKAPNRPIYLRHIRQGLRSIDPSSDERRYDFRAILNLLHRAQREGSVRLQRDRKGVWRIFTVSTTPATLPAAMPSAESVAEPAESPLEFTPAEVDVAWEEPSDPTEEVMAEGSTPEQTSLPAIEEAAPVSAAPGRKPRKPRPARGTTKTGARRASTRRKAKEPSDE
jgi:uncharacterized LabA/DUF88 family protein